MSKIAGISDKLGLVDADAEFDNLFSDSLHLFIEGGKLQFGICVAELCSLYKTAESKC